MKRAIEDNLLPEIIEIVLKDYAKGRIYIDKVQKFIEKSIGKEASDKLLKDLNQLALPTIIFNYADVTKSNVSIRYINRLHNSMLIHSKTVQGRAIEETFIESERMRVKRYLRVIKEPKELIESLKIWDNYITTKQLYSHRVNAMARYYYPDSIPKGRWPVKSEGPEEYEEYKRFKDVILPAINNEKRPIYQRKKQGQIKEIEVKFRPLIKAFLQVFEMLNNPNERRRAVVDALQVLIAYDEGNRVELYNLRQDIKAELEFVEKGIKAIKDI